MTTRKNIVDEAIEEYDRMKRHIDDPTPPPQGNSINDAAPEEWDRAYQKAMSTQIGGDHYKDFTIEPIEFITANNLGYCEGNVIKYICRFQEKGGREDLDKAIHYIELLKEAVYGY